MKTVGIIAEFNPFHNGHAYLIQKAKEITRANRVVVVMSGNYVQRGAPAFMDKFLRSEIAVLNGADLVLELPICYSVSSASHFANGAVRMLDALQCVDYLCFGSENTDFTLLDRIASILFDEPEAFKYLLQSNIKKGISFCQSREFALTDYLIDEIHFEAKKSQIHEIMSAPNCILAIEYLISLKRIHSNIRPIPILRTDKGYHSCEITQNLASASAIRSMIVSNSLSDLLKRLLPEKGFEQLENEFKHSYPIIETDFDQIIAASLIDKKYKGINFESFFDVSEFLSNRMSNYLDCYTDFPSFVQLVNSKVFTSGYVRRALFTILFEYTKNDFYQFRDNDYIYYFRVLAFNKNHVDLLNLIHRVAQYPLITKLKQANSYLSDEGMHMLLMNQHADSLYRMISMNKFNNNLPTEYQQGVKILNLSP